MPYPNYCQCGCEIEVSPGREFAQGHAIRRAHWLHQRAENSPSIRTRNSAQREIEDRGWENFGLMTGMRNTRINETAFGVEAEFFGISHGDSVYHLSRAGLSAQDDGYHHSPRTYWRVTTDGSVSGSGLELVSPILQRGNTEHEDEIRTASRALRRAGGKVNRSCGLHVHHSDVGMDVPDIAEAIAHYAVFQEKINSLLPPSRRNAGYAQPLTGGLSFKQTVNNHSSMSALKQRAGYEFQRHVAVNLTALQVHNTIEFRQHSGTLNDEKIQNWVAFTRLFMDVSKTGKTIEQLVSQYGGIDSINRDMSVTDMVLYMGGTQELATFYEARAVALRGNEDDEDVGDTADFDDSDGFYEDESDESGWCFACGSCTAHGACGWGDPDSISDNPANCYCVGHGCVTIPSWVVRG